MDIMPLDFKTELRMVIQKWADSGNLGDIAKHLTAHGATMARVAANLPANPYGPATGNLYNVFPDENDPNYGDPMGGPSPDDGA